MTNHGFGQNDEFYCSPSIKPLFDVKLHVSDGVFGRDLSGALSHCPLSDNIFQNRKVSAS
jgi:hypothetical protein